MGQTSRSTFATAGKPRKQSTACLWEISAERTGRSVKKQQERSQVFRLKLSRLEPIQRNGITAHGKRTTCAAGIKPGPLNSFDKTQPICNCKRMTQDWSDLEDQVADMTLAEFSRTMPAAFREMMRRFIPLISAALERQPDNPDKWGVAFAVGASFCAGRSMADIAAKLGCSRALLSYKARQFCEDCSLPPSGYMKSEDAVETAKSARNSKINEQQSKNQSLEK